MQPLRRSSLFLLELMIAILLFSLSAAVCVQVFVKSHTIKEKSTELSQAVLISASVAETIRSEGTFFKTLSNEFPLIESDDDVIYIYYDAKWQPTSSSYAAYVLRLETKLDSTVLTGTITVCKNASDDSPIYELEVKKHISKEDLSK